mmetsp:Transcript_9763/g.26521  ORF Transcript_9763/g.26521 Transcript_9763/m.26521 type:complete len:240 (+) Transcript_9763:486-1205(+)
MQRLHKLTPSQRHRRLKAGHQLLVTRGLVPVGVEVSDPGREVGVVRVERRGRGIILIHPVINGVNALHERLVDVEVDRLHVLLGRVGPHHALHNLPTEMLVDKSRRRQLDLIKSAAKHLLKSLLVVVEAVIPRVVLAAHIDDHVQRLEQLRIARTDDIRAGKFLGLVQEKATQGLITVEGTRVCPNLLRIRGSHDGRPQSLRCRGGQETSEGSACGGAYEPLHARTQSQCVISSVNCEL